MTRQAFNREDVEAFCNFLSKLAPQPSDHLRIEIQEGARFVKSYQYPAAAHKAMTARILAEEGDDLDIYACLGTVRKDASPRQSVKPSEFEKIFAFATDTSQESIDVAAKFGKSAILLQGAGQMEGLFLLDKAREPAELEGLRNGINELTKKFVRQNRIAFKCRIPGTVAYPDMVGYAPSEPTLTKMRLVA